MADAYSGFLKRLTAYRAGLSMTQEQIAKKLGMSQTKYSKFERGALKITSDTLRRLMELGWDIDYIMNGVTLNMSAADMNEMRRELSDVGEESLLRLLATILADAAKRCAMQEAVQAEIRFLLFCVSVPDEMTALRTCRGMIGKTQEQMADALGLGVKTYRMYERGEKELTADMVLALSSLSGCRASVFLLPEDMEWNIIRYVWGLFDKPVQEELRRLIMEFVGFLRSLKKK